MLFGVQSLRGFHLGLYNGAIEKRTGGQYYVRA